MYSPCICRANTSKVMINFIEIFKFSRPEVTHAFAQGKFFCRTQAIKIITSPFVAHLPQPEHAKLLIVTPRRIGKAHDRNLLRRRIKEIFYGNQLYTFKPALYALFTYPGATKLTYDELKNFLVTNFTQKKS